MICPVNYSSNPNKEDSWQLRGEDLCCSYCGGFAPGPFLEGCKTTETGYLDVTDKCYKLYIHRPSGENTSHGAIKFYTYHLNKETEAEDLKLINDTVKRLKANNPFYQQFIKEKLEVIKETASSTLEKSSTEIDINDEGFFLTNIKNQTDKARKELKQLNKDRIDLAIKDIKARIVQASKKGLRHISYLLTVDISYLLTVDEKCELEVFADFVIERLFFMFRCEMKYENGAINIHW